MKLVQAAPGKALVEISNEEMASLLTVIGVELGYLQPWPGGKPPTDVQTDLTKLHDDILGALKANTDSAEAVGPPFAVGERVVLSLDLTGPVPGLQDGEPATVLSSHPEDDSRDYPWCMVCLSDGRELALPAGLLRRPRTRS